MVAVGETESLRVNVETEGDLSIYECVWTLNPNVGELVSGVTEFVQGQDDNWYSEHQWLVPTDGAGQEVHMEVAIRLKGSEKALGKDGTYATIVPTITGDVNGDADGNGVVNALDITKVERIIAGLDASTSGADANQDGDVNAIDITKVERIIAGLD